MPYYTISLLQFRINDENLEFWPKLLTQRCKDQNLSSDFATTKQNRYYKNLLHKQQSLDIMQLPAFKRLIDHHSQICFACEHRRNGREVTVGGIGDDLRQRGLAHARRSTQNDG